MSIDACTEGVDFSEDSTCFPYKGAMGFYSTCETCSFSEETMLLNAIADGCDNDVYLDGDVMKKVIFIGTRPEVVFTMNSAPSNEDESRQPRVTMMGSFSLFFIIAGILIGLAVFQLGRNKRDDHDEESYSSAQNSDSSQ